VHVIGGKKELYRYDSKYDNVIHKKSSKFPTPVQTCVFTKTENVAGALWISLSLIVIDKIKRYNIDLSRITVTFKPERGDMGLVDIACKGDGVVE